MLAMQHNYIKTPFRKVVKSVLNMDKKEYTRQEKAIRFMLRNEDYDYDKKPHKPINEGDGKEYTWLGLTKEDDEKYLPSPYKTLWDLYELSKNDLPKAIDIARQVYIKGYWNPLLDEIIDENFAIRYFDLSVNMGHRGVGKVLEAALKELDISVSQKVSSVNQEVVSAINKAIEIKKDFIVLFKKKALDRYKSFATFSTYGKGWENRLNKSEEER
jgi:hypothetical protein